MANRIVRRRAIRQSITHKTCGSKRVASWQEIQQADKREVCDGMGQESIRDKNAEFHQEN